MQYVYVVTHVYGYVNTFGNECLGSDIIGIYKTKEKAKEVKAKNERYRISVHQLQE